MLATCIADSRWCPLSSTDSESSTSPIQSVAFGRSQGTIRHRWNSSPRSFSPSTSMSAMTNVVDFTVPDPLSRLRFANQVAAYLRSADAQQHAVAREALEKTFRAWLSAAQVFDTQTANEPRLAAIAQRRKEWTELATSGLSAIEFIESGRTAP